MKANSTIALGVEPSDTIDGVKQMIESREVRRGEMGSRNGLGSAFQAKGQVALSGVVLCLMRRWPQWVHSIFVLYTSTS